MRFNITGKNMNVSDKLREQAVAKLSKLEKYFSKMNEANVTMMVEKKRHIIEVTIPVKGSVIRAEEEAENMYAAIDAVVDVLERQLNKHKTKLSRRHKGHGTFVEEFYDYEDDYEDEGIDIVRSKRFAVKPMDAEEACMEMDLLGHDFFVFRNRDTDEVNVVYKRKAGQYGLIEPEI